MIFMRVLDWFLVIQRYLTFLSRRWGTGRRRSDDMKSACHWLTFSPLHTGSGRPPPLFLMELEPTGIQGVLLIGLRWRDASQKCTRLRGELGCPLVTGPLRMSLFIKSFTHQ